MNRMIVLIFVILFVEGWVSTANAQNYRSYAQAASASGVNSLTINKPAGTVVNDVMIAAISIRPNSATVAPPSGWTQIVRTNNSGGSVPNAQVIYRKTATTGEPASYAFTFTGSTGAAGGILTFYNINVTTPVSISSGQATASSLTHSTPTVTTTTANNMIIACHTIPSSATFSTPGGMTQPVDISSASIPSASGITLAMNYGVQAVAGATGVKTSTASNDADAGIAQIVALNPAPVASISYSASTFCSSAGTASVTQTGATGGTYSAPAGLTLNASTGAITLGTSTAGTYTVTYTYSSVYTTTTTVTVNTAATLSGTSTVSCVGGSTGSITASASGGTTPYTYSLNSGTYQSSALFSNLAAGTYTLNVKTASGCVTSTSVTVNTYANSTDDQNVATADSWTGHMYQGRTFTNYIGRFTETETFNETFGGSATCFNVVGNSQTSSIYTEDFAVKYLMNSTKNGLYVADLGSDDGARLTVDGTLVYNNWNDHSLSSNPRVLMNLSGSSSLKYEYYENGGDNVVSFQNLTLVLANTLSANITQSLCIGSAGTAISGDTYGVLPSGITLSGTGYQWSYSTTPGGTRTNITGATGATFTPSAAAAPFNVAGTYYISRSASVSSANNTGVNSYVATNLSNAAIIIVAGAPTATISYPGSPYCSSSGTATVTLTGNAGGTFSSTTGLAINATTGDIALGSSTAGTYTVKYIVTTTCGTYTATTSITITTQPSVTGNYPGNPYCTNFGIAYPTGSKTGADGTISSATGLSINSSTGVVDLAASMPGSYTLTYSVPAGGGCALYTATYNLVIIGSPTATISYAGSPYCPNAGTVSVTRTGTAGGVYSSTTGLSINTSTGDINTNASTPGTYTVTYKIAAAGSCAAFTTTTSVVITAPGTWTGAISTAWNVPGNWKCNIIPTITTNVIIPSGLGNYPVITTNITGLSNNLTLQSGTSVTVTNGTLQVAGAATTAGGKITTTSGKVEFNGSAAQTVPANLFTSNVVKDLVITNTAGVTLAGAVRVTNSVGFGSVNGGILNSNGNLTLVSTSSNTANLLDITNGGVNSGNKINGNVVVERYTQGKRAYRFLTAPVTSTTSIKTNWMENANNTAVGTNINLVPGYGTQITGTGGSTNGFDVTQTNNPSLYTFNVNTQAWVAATNTNGLFAAGNGYRIMVRGSRNVDLTDNYAVSSATTLRATGTLLTGPVTFTKAGGSATAGTPALSSTVGGYGYIANPYASSVNWFSVMGTMTDVSPTCYIFDPTVSGSNGRGAYVAFNGTLRVSNVISSVIDNNLQSGQGFFVQTTGPSPVVTFQERYKTTTFLPVFRTANDVPHINVSLLLPAELNATGAADATGVYFSDDFSNAIGDDDSYKFTNQDENIAIVREGKTLSLEGRKLIAGTDSVPLKIWQLTQKNYTLKVAVANFGSNVEVYLEDKYLNTAKLLEDGETPVPFTITADAASLASDRFRIIFETIATLPVRLTGVRAYQKNKGVQVDWAAESESNIDLYEIERSGDAKNFTTVGSVKAKNNGGQTTTYNGFDEKPLVGDNYYRIKSIDKSGEIKYSEVVKVQISGLNNTITVANNPVRGSTITVLFNNVTKGTYAATLISVAGEKVYAGNIVNAGGTVYQQINLQRVLPAGVYQLRLVGDSLVKNIEVLVQ